MNILTYDMNLKSAVAVFVFLAGSAFHSAEAANDDRKSISVDELNDLKIIGKLGIPLGQAVEMEGIIISEGSLKSKTGRSYRIKVTSVAGRKLMEPVAMEFQSPGSESLPPTLTELLELKHGRSVTSRTVELMEEAEKEYVGSKVKFLGFESGAYGGLPEGLPDPGTWGGGGNFEFRSYVVVIFKV